jgi:MoaA/NifB/PqqE/SkfB family radical SAM enzyme
MSEETFRALLPALSGMKRLHIAGSGEPLMNRQLVKFIDLAREANPKIEIAITTNGTILTEAILRAFIERRLSHLTVSMDGVSHETVSSIRIGINTAKVVASLELLERLKREMNSALPRLQLNFVVGYGNYAELPDFVRAARRYGVREILVLEVYAGTEESVRNDLRHNLDRDAGAGLRLAKRLADEAGIVLRLPLTSHTACFHPSTPHVAENGDVSPCCYVDYEGRSFFIDGREVRMPKIVYGNVREGGLRAAWRSPGYRALRTRNAQGDLPPPCQTCLAARAPVSIRVQQVLG